MPWKEQCAMSVREQFVWKARQPAVNMSELCREFGVSRKTGYKWLKRYEDEGLRGLEDLSRAPDTSPLKVDGDLVAEVVALRVAHPTWGPKKLADIMSRKHGKNAPSQRTVARILVRSGLIQRTRRRRSAGAAPVVAPKVTPTKPNDLWTVDFKGWWKSWSGEHCEPLTIRDAYSRMVLAIAVLPSTKLEPVLAVFKEVFTTYGTPNAIHTDGGTPFVMSRGQVGLTKLSAWWLALGIEHYRSRPATPSDNGGHERMHRDMADELERYAALNREAQQAACDRWRHDFNHHRPHEALGMKRPAEVYSRSEVTFDDKPIAVTYPDHFHIRAVGSVGHITFRYHDIFISWALAKYPVGVEYVDGTQFNVWFAHRLLGSIDLSDDRPTLRGVGWNYIKEGGDAEQTKEVA